MFLSCNTADQVVDNTRQRTARNVENRAQNRIDRGVDRALDALEDTIVPGDVIIFEDDLAGEKNGGFPSRWDLQEFR